MRDLTQGGRENLAACLSMITLTAIMIVARFATRASQRQRPLAADWLCLGAVITFYVNCILILHYILVTSVDGSLDTSITHGTEQLRNILKLSYPLEIIFGIHLTLVKLSILLFYWDIFVLHNSSTFNRRIILVIAMTCIVWFVIVTFIIVFQCNPVHAYWDKLGEAPYCMKIAKLFLGYEITNLFLDVFILCIPLPIVWHLNLPLSKRVGLMGIFFLGGFVCVTSIVRLTVIWNPPNVEANFSFSNVIFWSTLQAGMAITCACLPTLAPVLAMIVKSCSQFKTWSISVWSRLSVNYKRGFRISDGHELTGNQPYHAADGFAFGASRIWTHGDKSRANTNPERDPVPPMIMVVDRNVEVV